MKRKSIKVERNKKRSLVNELFFLAELISLENVRLKKSKSKYEKQQIEWQTKVAMADLKKILSRLEKFA